LNRGELGQRFEPEGTLAANTRMKIKHRVGICVAMILATTMTGAAAAWTDVGDSASKGRSNGPAA
jgi:hypothetical protein